MPQRPAPWEKHLACRKPCRCFLLHIIRDPRLSVTVPAHVLCFLLLLPCHMSSELSRLACRAGKHVADDTGDDQPLLMPWRCGGACGACCGGICAVDAKLGDSLQVEPKGVAGLSAGGADRTGSPPFIGGGGAPPAAGLVRTWRRSVGWNFRTDSTGRKSGGTPPAATLASRCPRLKRGGNGLASGIMLIELLPFPSCELRLGWLAPARE